MMILAMGRTRILILDKCCTFISFSQSLNNLFYTLKILKGLKISILNGKPLNHVNPKIELNHTNLL